MHVKAFFWGRLTSSHSRSDNAQFASEAHRGPEDSALTLLHVATKHIKSPEAYARIESIDLSSAFKAIRIDRVLNMLSKLDTDGRLALRIKDFLYDPPRARPRLR